MVRTQHHRLRTVERTLSFATGLNEKLVQGPAIRESEHARPPNPDQNYPFEDPNRPSYARESIMAFRRRDADAWSARRMKDKLGDGEDGILGNAVLFVWEM